jgi:hypothetical protein
MLGVVNKRVDIESATPIAKLGERQYSINRATGLIGLFEYVKATAAITAFDAIMRVANEDGDCDAATAASKTIVDATKSWTVNAYVNYLATIIDGAAPAGETLRVLSNTATVLSLAAIRTGGTEEFSAALATSHRYSIHHPYYVAKTSALAKKIVGVAQMAVTANYYFWMLVKGRGIVNGTTADEAGLGATIVSTHAVAVDGLALVELI